MKKLSLVWASALVTVMVLSGATPFVGNVTAAIPVPHNMWGHPYDETTALMDVDELITSWVDGVEYGRNPTFLAASEVWFDIDTAGDWMLDPTTPETPWIKEGGNLNEPIMYAWGDMTNINLDPGGDGQFDYGVFEETEPWNTTVVLQQDINLAVMQPPIFPKISWIIPEPADGDPDYVFIYTETAFFDMSGFYLEKNDGVLKGPTFALSGYSSATAYFYANLTTMDLDGCGDELKLVWTNPGTAFGGNDIVVDRVEWNATVGGCHDSEPDNTIMTDAIAPSAGNATHRTGVAPIYADDTNDNAVDFITSAPWPRPVIGPPILTWDTPAGGEDWTGNQDHVISFYAYDNAYTNELLLAWVNYSLTGGLTWDPAILNGSQPISLWGDASTLLSVIWSAPFANETDNVMLELCVVNPDGESSCEQSQLFSLDSEAPWVDSTNPVDDASGVPIDQVVTITFSELMNTGSVVYTLSPSANPIDNWPTNDVLEISHDLFAPGTNYWVNITAACDDSITGNCMPGEYDFNFTTYIVTPPAIDLTAPVGGEIWSGNSDHDITWSMWHNGTGGLGFAYVWLNYSCGGAWFPITEGGAILPKWDQPYQWTTPAGVDEVDCFIRVTIQDTDDHIEVWDDSPEFTIDSTAPTVTGTNPMPDQTDVAIGTDVVVTFSEAMDTASVEASFSMEETVSGTSVSGDFTWANGDTELTFDPTADLTGDTEYTVTIDTGAKDISVPGNFLAADHVFSFTTEITNTPPTVTVTAPTSTALWRGGTGSSGFIEWTMDDDGGAENLTVDVSYIYSGATTAITTASLTGGVLNYTWTPVACPAGAGADAVGVQILVEVTDQGTLSASDTSDSFTIDCTIPTGTIAWTGEEKEDETLSFSISNPSETIDSYDWDFGDDTAHVAGATPTHAYDKGDTYVVTCILTDAAGNEGTVTASLEIESKPGAKDFLSEYWWLILIIIIVVIVIIILAVVMKRRKPAEEEEIPLEEEVEEIPEEEEVEYVEEEELMEEEEPVEEAAPPPVAPAAAPPPPAEEAPAAAGETKECPSCGTVVPADATECFLCGASL